MRVAACNLDDRAGEASDGEGCGPVVENGADAELPLPVVAPAEHSAVGA